MSRTFRALSCALVLLAAAACTDDEKSRDATSTPPAASSAAVTDSSSPAATTTAASPTYGSSSPAVETSAATSSSPVASASDPPGTVTSPAPSAAPSAAASSSPANPGPAGPGGQVAADEARKLLVTGPELGGDWLVVPLLPEEEGEQGDLCGTATAAEQGRILDVWHTLANDQFQGGARHTIARYQPGTAPAVARTMLNLLIKCKNLKQDFDGSSAVVNVTPQTPNMATFTLTFDSGSVNHGGIAISNTGDYVSTSMSYAVDAPTAAQLAGELDQRAQKKLTAAGVT